VAEEKTPSGVVWICCRFRVLVVNAMIADPVKDGAFVGHAGTEHNKDFQSKACFEGTVTPQSMIAHNNAQSRHVVDKVGPNPRVGHGVRCMIDGCINSSNMTHWQVNAHEGVKVLSIVVIFNDGRNVLPHLQREIHLQEESGGCWSIALLLAVTTVVVFVVGMLLVVALDRIEQF